MFTAGLFLLGALVVLLLPRASESITRQISARPVASFFLGFALVICIPVAAVLAMITVIGIPLGFILLFLWPAVIMLGYLVSVIFFGDALAALLGRMRGRRPGRPLRVFGLALVLVALMLASKLSVLGAVAILLLLFAGTGAFALGMRNAARQALD